MSELSQTEQQKLPDLKKRVENWYKYWEKNIDRYHKYMKFVYESSLSPDDIAKLIILKKPNIEFNVLEAYINRRIGEFSKQEPTLEVRSADGIGSDEINDKQMALIETVEGHTREIIDDQSNDGFRTHIMKDTMGGGFSVAEVYTEFSNPLSFEQCIKVGRVFDPTLCGFDPMAQDSHKGDGEYCFKLFPRTKSDFEQDWGEAITKEINFNRNAYVGSFNWSYNQGDDPVILECHMWIKERKKQKIAKLSNGKIILKKDYQAMLDQAAYEMITEQAPIIIQERWSFIETIRLFKFCQTKVLSVEDTVCTYLPLVFFDGNSVMIKNMKDGTSGQMTRPYVYQAEGVQRLKNFAGQCIASELETMVQHKFMAALESIPEDYLDAFTNPQQAQLLAYNVFYNKNTSIQLPPPQVIPRTETPSIVQATFEGTDRTTQTILGSFDAQQGIVGDKISGRAIEQGALQSDASSLPYLESFIKGLNRLGQILLDLIPKYYLTPRTIPIKKPNGLRSYKVINDPNVEGSVSFNYDPNSLKIKIQAGVNSSVQKRYSLEQIAMLMQISPNLAQIINDVAPDILVDNIDIKGADELKLRVTEYMQAKQQAPEQPDPMQEALEIEKERVERETEVEAARIEQKREEAEGNLAIKSAQVAIEEQKAQNEWIKLVAELEEKKVKAEASQNREAAELANDAIRLALDISKHRASVTTKAEEMTDDYVS